MTKLPTPHTHHESLSKRKQLNLLHVRLLHLVLLLRQSVTRSDSSRRVVLGHIVADGGVLRSVLADMTGRKGGEEETEKSGSEADPDDNHCHQSAELVV